MNYEDIIDIVGEGITFRNIPKDKVKIVKMKWKGNQNELIFPLKDYCPQDGIDLVGPQ